jgi:hypothetical protein
MQYQFLEPTSRRDRQSTIVICSRRPPPQTRPSRPQDPPQSAYKISKCAVLREKLGRIPQGVWLVVDWPTIRQDFPVDLTQSCQRRGEPLSNDIWDFDPPPLFIASCARREDARALVKLARNGGDIRFYRTD